MKKKKEVEIKPTKQLPENINTIFLKQFKNNSMYRTKIRLKLWGTWIEPF